MACQVQEGLAMTWPPPAGMAGKGGFDDRGTLCMYSEKAKGIGLAACAMGFAEGVVGGRDGDMYIVTDPSDKKDNPPPGTLRYGTDAGKKWIVFDKPMTIKLEYQLWIKSFVTIDGRGHSITITACPLVIRGQQNIIIHNVEVRDVDGDTDAVHIFGGSKKIWIDHCKFTNAARGLTTAIEGSTDITFSNNLYHDNYFVMLLGASDTDERDKDMRVTVYRNYFKNCNQRMPHVRFGTAHVTNNCYENWAYYCLGGRVQGNIRSECNVFNPGPEKKEVTPWWPAFDKTPGTDSSSTILSFNDALLHGTTLHEFKTGPTFPVSYCLDIRNTLGLWEFVTRFAGPIRPPPLVKPACVK